MVFCREHFSPTGAELMTDDYEKASVIGVSLTSCGRT